MIENETQYELSRNWVDRFKKELINLQGISCCRKNPLTDIEIEDVKSQISELEKDMADYESKRVVIGK